MSILLSGTVAIACGYILFRDEKSITISKEKRKLKEKLNSLQEGVDEKYRYKIIKYIPKEYGCDVILSISIGNNLSDFHKMLPNLKNILNANIIAELSSEKNTIYSRIHYRDKDISEKDEIRFIWYDLMFNNTIDKNKLRNKDYETFTIKSISEEKYGYKIILTVPVGLECSSILDNLKPIINAFKCTVWGNYDKYHSEITLTIIKHEFPDTYKYKPIPTRVNEFYVGMTYDYKEIKIPLEDYCHVMYSGMTGMGKTIALLMAITNLVYYHSPKELELYALQISGKQDLQIFKDIAHCKYYAKTMNDVEKVLRYLVKEMKRRNSLIFEGKEYISSISDWNKKYPHDKFSEVYIAMDESAQYQPTARDSKEDKKQKQRCLSSMTQLLQEGRNSGIHILTCLQRPSKDSFDAPMKAQIGVKICFKQPNMASSLVAIDSGDAIDLKKREAIVEFNGRYLMKTLYLTPAMIKQYISKWELEKGYYLYLNNNGDIVDDDSTVQKCKITPPPSADNNLPSITLSRKDKQLLRRKEYLNNR